MASTSRRQKGRVISTLDVFINTLNVAKDTCGIPPAQIAFSSASVLLTMIQGTMANDQDYDELGRTCADVCEVLYRGLKGRRLDELNQAILDAIGDLAITVAEMEKKVVKQGKRNAVSRFVLAKGDKDKIIGWKQDLFRVLHVFNTELAIATHMVVAGAHAIAADTRTVVTDTHTTVADTYKMVVDLHRNALTAQQGIPSNDHPTKVRPATTNTVGSTASHFIVPPGESPPPAPKACFGRENLVEKIVGFAENLKPIALVGAGGIGKTAIGLTVLHHSRIEERFGDNRRFIRCDQFPPSPAHFLARLSKVIGAGVENPEDLTPLRPFLSSKEMFIILDNAESVLDPKGANAEELYSLVAELCQFKTLCVCITSRIMTTPSHCKRPEIPTLSMEAASDIFYGIYGDGEQSNIIGDLLQRLDFHALSITLLATAASHNGWDYDRLVKEWDTQRAQVLQTDYNKSLAATIELSLTSPTFCSLGPNARDLLGVVAFFPQGIDEKNLGWLFPTISNRNNIFDKFRALSLTHRSNGFITMLAPILDYLVPQNPQSSPLLCATRDHYFNRLSIKVNPGRPGFEEARWIASEDVNVEHLFDVFTSIDQNTSVIWDVCYYSMGHFYWHKPRRTILGSKFEGLADDHPSKPKCLLELSRLFGRIGNHAERKRLLVLTLELERRRRNDIRVASTLRQLSNVNRLLGLYEEGIPQAKEALEIFERIGDIDGQGWCLNDLAFLLFYDKQLSDAENAASRAIDLIPKKGQEYLFCDLHRILGKIYGSKGEKKKAVRYFETALGTASSFNWNSMIFWTYHSLAELFCDNSEYDDARVQIELAKQHAVNETYKLGRATQLEADIWYRQHKLEDAKSGGLRALEIYQKSGATHDAQICSELLQKVEQAIENRTTSLQV